MFIKAWSKRTQQIGLMLVEFSYKSLASADTMNPSALNQKLFQFIENLSFSPDWTREDVFPQTSCCWWKLKIDTAWNDDYFWSISFWCTAMELNFLPLLTYLTGLSLWRKMVIFTMFLFEVYIIDLKPLNEDYLTFLLWVLCTCFFNLPKHL